MLVYSERPATATAAKPVVIFINGMTNQTEVYRFVDCLRENTPVGFTSDAVTTSISDIHVVGG